MYTPSAKAPRRAPSVPLTANTAKVCIVKGIAAGMLSQAQSAMRAADIEIQAMSLVFMRAPETKNARGEGMTLSPACSADDLFAADEYGLDVQLAVEYHDVRPLAGSQLAAVRESCRCGRDAGRRGDRALERDAEAHSAPHGFADVDAAARERAVEQSCNAAAELYGQSRQLVVAVRHARTAQGVRDEREAAGK